MSSIATFPAKDLGDQSWYMGSEYTRDRVAKTLEILQTQIISNVLNRFDVEDTSLVPLSISSDLRAVMNDGNQVDEHFREVFERLFWITNQTRPNISNAVREFAQHSYEPKEVHWKAAWNMLEHLKATADLGWTFDGDSGLGVNKGFNLELYVNADYASKATDRCSVF